MGVPCMTWHLSMYVWGLRAPPSLPVGESSARGQRQQSATLLCVHVSPASFLLVLSLLAYALSHPPRSSTIYTGCDALSCDNCGAAFCALCLAGRLAYGCMAYLDAQYPALLTLIIPTKSSWLLLRTVLSHKGPMSMSPRYSLRPGWGPITSSTHLIGDKPGSFCPVTSLDPPRLRE